MYQGIEGEKCMKISNRTSVLPSRAKFTPLYSGSVLSQDLWVSPCVSHWRFRSAEQFSEDLWAGGGNRGDQDWSRGRTSPCSRSCRGVSSLHLRQPVLNTPVGSPTLCRGGHQGNTHFDSNYNLWLCSHRKPSCWCIKLDSRQEKPSLEDASLGGKWWDEMDKWLSGGQDSQLGPGDMTQNRGEQESGSLIFCLSVRQIL